MAGGGGSPRLHLLIFLMADLCSLIFCVCGSVVSILLEMKISPLLVPQSRRCLIFPTTFVTVLIVHIVGIVRVHIRDPKP